VEVSVDCEVRLALAAGEELADLSGKSEALVDVFGQVLTEHLEFAVSELFCVQFEEGSVYEFMHLLAIIRQVVRDRMTVVQKVLREVERFVLAYLEVFTFNCPPSAIEFLLRVDSDVWELGLKAMIQDRLIDLAAHFKLEGFSK